MEERKFIVEGKFGVQIHVLGYVPETVIGVLHIFHGKGEHKDRYTNFMKWMSKKGYACFAHDHRKHGESVDKDLYSVGQFTDADRFEYIIDDAHYVVRKIKDEFTNVPYTILGHSMGSIILRRYLTKYSGSADKAIIMGTLPIIKKSRVFAPLLIAKVLKLFKGNQPSEYMENLLGKDLNKRIDNPVSKNDWLSTDPKQVEKYDEDPLCGYAYTLDFYIEFFNMLVKVNNSDVLTEGRDIPILFISGKDDPVGDYGNGVREVYELYSAHGYFQLTFKLMDDFRHEILNENNRTTTYKIIEEWLSS